MSEKKAISRRTLLKVVGAGAAAAAIGAGAYYASTPTGPSAPAPALRENNMVMWAWGVDFVTENIRAYNEKVEKTQGVHWNLLDIPQEVYREAMIARLTAKTPVDLMYNDDGQITEFDYAGYLAYMEDYHPEIKDYLPDIFDGLVPALLSTKPESKGKMFSLPYYGNYVGFLYNETMMNKAGFDEPPKTWEDWIDQATAMKNKGICKYPIAPVFAVWQFWETLFFFAYCQKDGYVFDKNNEPVFESEDSALYRGIKFVTDGIKNGLIVPNAVTLDENSGNLGFANEDWAYLISARYELPVLNDPSFSKAAGHARHAKSPSGGGGVQTTVCWIRPYGQTVMNVARGKQAIEDAWNLMSYLGGKTNDDYLPDFKNGKYRSAVKWITIKGLDQPFKSVYQIPEVKEAVAKGSGNQPGAVELYVDSANDSRLKDGMLTPWWGKWSGVYGLGPARSTLEAVLLGRKDIMDGLKSIATMWTDLKASYGP